MITIEIERSENIFAQSFDVLRRSKFLIEFAELFFAHRARSRVALLKKAFLPCSNITASQFRVLGNWFVNMIVQLTMTWTHVDLEERTRARLTFFICLDAGNESGDSLTHTHTLSGDTSFAYMKCYVVCSRSLVFFLFLFASSADETGGKERINISQKTCYCGFFFSARVQLQRVTKLYVEVVGFPSLRWLSEKAVFLAY